MTTKESRATQEVLTVTLTAWEAEQLWLAIDEGANTVAAHVNAACLTYWKSRLRKRR